MPASQLSRQHKNRLYNLANATRSQALIDIAMMRLTMALVAQVFATRECYLLGMSRGQARLALARHVLQYLAHIVFGMSLTRIAYLSRRDRTTVAYACRRVEDGRDDGDFDKAMFFLELALVTMRKRIGETAN